jgi:hypothetical protein
MSGRAKRMTAGLLGCFLAAGITAGPAAAQTAQPAAAAPVTTVRSISVEGFASILQDQGYRAEPAQGKYQPLIYTGMAGRRVTIGFYDCREGACGSVEYRMVFTKDDDLNVELANAWNVRKRYAKANVAEDGSFMLQFDFDLSNGVTTGALRGSVLRFQQMVGLFDQFLRERAAAQAQRPQAPARSAERPA